MILKAQNYLKQQTVSTVLKHIFSKYTFKDPSVLRRE